MIKVLSRATPAIILLMTSAMPGISAAQADINLESIPTSWRLQDYLSGGLIAYFTGSSCPQQSLTLPPSTPTDSVNRFWSAVMYAKSASKTIGVFYNPSTCYITSFYLKEG
jgi:hypothetical protein